MTDEQLDCALDLNRRLPPTNVEDNLAGLIDLVPDLTEDLLSVIDQPLKVATDNGYGRDYLLCDYNRDGDSFRSPWSNQYFPKLKDGALPSKKLRDLEVQANEMFDVYRDLYYEGGVSSVYMWDTEDGFAACVLIKKVGEQNIKKPIQGVWDSIHVIEVTDQGRSALYKIVSTVMLSMITEQKESGSINLSGSMTKEKETDLKVEDQSSHLINMGKVVEDMESQLRNTLDQIYFGKTFDVVNDLRSLNGLKVDRKRKEEQQKVFQNIVNSGKN
ncbi:f-actin-capping protein subunit beta [Anaeramoeba flamelloides]|uniref:F-actin-capping protein subunit beta n=1 Tax=Anaeramoeba flamelloides TaxID=1746091 RepID=A0ABQ8XMD1_9EUKA|nr:f-actin-capping protein subunit beta [Anaeramoeba flamelloides]